jgi:hypothetical protein
MVQGRGGLRFALKAGQRLRVSGDFIGQELEGNKSVQPGVLGLLDHTHPAAAELFDDAVVRDGLTDQRRSSLCAGSY